MPDVFEFTEEFQVKALSLLYGGTLPHSSLQPGYFQNPLLAEICESILSLQASYGALTPAMVETHLLAKKVFKDREYRSELKAILPQVFLPVWPHETKYISDLVGKFTRLQAYRQRLRTAVDLLQQEDTEIVEKLDDLFAQPLSANGNGHDLGEFYFSSLPDRIQRMGVRPNVIRSLIPPLDHCLEDGGFARQSLTLFAALTSAGKSFSLAHIALAAILQKKKTVFYSLEMPTDKVASRMDASLSGVKTYELRAHQETITRALALRQKLFGDILLLKKMRAGQTKVSDFRAHLTQLKQAGFEADAIVVDYINLMRPEAMTREGRHRDLGSVYVDLNGLIDEFNLWGFAAAQANRLGYQSPLLTSKDLSDSFEGAMHSHIVITINRNDDEAAREKARLYIAKDRYGVDKRVIEIDTNYAKGAFYTRRKRI